MSVALKAAFLTAKKSDLKTVSGQISTWCGLGQTIRKCRAEYWRVAMSIRVLLVADQQIVRLGLRSLLETETEMEVIAEADNASNALKLARELSPDVVVLNINESETEGLDVMRRMTAEAPRLKVVALTNSRGNRFVMDVFGAGASGYVLQDCAWNEMSKAITAVANNQKYLCSEMSRSVINGFLHHVSVSMFGRARALSAREREVLRCMSEGKSVKDVASCLRLSPLTVEKHRQNIMRKLNIHTSTDLIRYGILEGLGSTGT
jgi:two-component system, NarL family, response regulator NreC